MSTPLDLIDSPTEVMTYGGIADADTAYGRADERAEWCGALAAYLARSCELGRRHRVSGGAPRDLVGTSRPGRAARRHTAPAAPFRSDRGA